MTTLVLRDAYVLVTGASSGLGLAIARHLALDHGAKLLLVARREARLLELADELTRLTGRPDAATVLAADLSRLADLDRVEARCAALGVSAAVLNAGATHYGPSEALLAADLMRLINLNATGTAQLANALASHWKRTGVPGALLFIGSIAGLIPLPYQAAYAATKAFVTSFGLALGQELAAHHISVTVFAPGGIDTAMIHDAGLGAFRGWLSSPDVSARQAIDAMTTRRALVVPGLGQRLGVFGARLLPQRLVTAAAGALFRRGLVRR